MGTHPARVARAVAVTGLFSDRDLAEICAIVLTVLAHGEPLVETLNFNEVDVDR